MRDIINLNRGWYFTTAYDDKFISNDYGEHEWQFVNSLIQTKNCHIIILMKRIISLFQHTERV